MQKQIPTLSEQVTEASETMLTAAEKLLALGFPLHAVQLAARSVVDKMAEREDSKRSE